MHHQILELQKKTHQNTSTNTLESLQEAANLIAQNPTISDSLKSENDYLIGYYYSNNGQVDSAATYYYKAIDRIKDSIKNDREFTYIYSAWSTHQQLQEYGECIAISKRFESLITEKDDTNKLRLYYLFLQTYIASQNYEEAIRYADLRIKTYTDNNDAENVTLANITRTEIQYNYLNDKKELIKHLTNCLSKRTV